MFVKVDGVLNPPSTPVVALRELISLQLWFFSPPMITSYADYATLHASSSFRFSRSLRIGTDLCAFDYSDLDWIFNWGEQNLVIFKARKTRLPLLSVGCPWAEHFLHTIAYAEVYFCYKWTMWLFSMWIQKSQKNH